MEGKNQIYFRRASLPVDGVRFGKVGVLARHKAADDIACAVAPRQRPDIIAARLACLWPVLCSNLTS